MLLAIVSGGFAIHPAWGEAPSITHRVGRRFQFQSAGRQTRAMGYPDRENSTRTAGSLTSVNMPENMPDSCLIAFGAGSQWGRVGCNRLIINGKSDRVPLAVPSEAQTVLLARHNQFERREIPVHLHRKADCGERLKNTIDMARLSAVEIDFIDDAIQARTRSIVITRITRTNL